MGWHLQGKTMSLVTACISLFVLFALVPTFAETSAETEIKNVEAQLAVALLHSDVDVLNHIYADDYVHTGNDGVVTDKATRVAEFRSGARKVTSLKRAEILIRIYGNAAVVTDVDTVTGEFQEHHFGGRARAIRVYVKRRKWQLVAAQTTALQ
jgi:hypothetical protein